jgi:cysteine synthase A
MKQEGVTEVGNTPLIRIEGVFAKLECVNPTGSIKDRMAKYIIDESEKRGLLKKGMTVVEATSGNTGIAISCYARKKGYDVVIIMPENMTEERKSLIRGYGAKLILCSREGSFPEAVRMRDEMSKDKRYFNTDQFSNRLNVECHYTTTGKEIIRQLRTQSLVPDAFVAGVGTGGTLMGVGKALRELNQNVCVVAVEPAESPVMSGGIPGPHEIQGIGDGFIPEVVKGRNGGLDPLISKVVQVKSDDAKRASAAIAKNHGYCVGVSSGANFLVAKELSRTLGTVVTVFPDGFNRYVSLGLVSSGKCRYDGGACSTASPASDSSAPGA